MLDVYFGNMDGVEVHAETPEEEQEAAFILNSALSGKTAFLGGCLCPSEADSTVSKGFRLMLSEGTDLYVTPALDVDGTPALEICCTTANEEQQEADEPAYTITISTSGPKNKMNARWALQNTLEGKALVYNECIKPLVGNRPLCEGVTLRLGDKPEQEADTEVFLVPGINDDGEAVLLIRCRSCDEEAWDSYCDFMGRNFSGIWFCPHEDLDLEEMDDKDTLEWVYESDDMEDEWPF